jgi:transcriptional activator of cad operon
MSLKPSSNPERCAGDAARFRLGAWLVDPETGRLSQGDSGTSLEPRLMALLTLLASAPGRVFSRDAIESALWPDVVVGEDTVARAISRLRRVLGDSVDSPRYIETLPKRGYRLIANVSPPAADDTAPPPSTRRWPLYGLAVIACVGLVWLLTTLSPDESPTADATESVDQQVARADDLYMRFTRADNEAAIALYERVLAEAPDNAGAQAGLANALVQRVVRWPFRPGSADEGASSLAEALDRGLTGTAEAEQVLARAVAMAERAVRLAPRDPDALKALAFAYTAQGDLERGVAIYEQVLAIDADAWPALINLGEIESMRGNIEGAVGYFERAYAAMTRAYEYEAQRVGPWQVALGVLIGETYGRLGQPADAELWYRRVLAEAPYEPEATVRLAQLLADSGDEAEARSLCRELSARVGEYPGCTELLEPARQ